MLILNFLYDVIILVIVIGPLNLLETSLSYSKPGLLNDKIRIFLLLFYYSGRYVVVDDIVASNCWALPFFVNELSLYLRFKCGWYLFFTVNELWVIRTWRWPFVLLLIFASNLSWSELSSVSSLYFIDQFVLHCISRFIGPWSWYFSISIYEGGAPSFLLNFCSLFRFSLLAKLKADVIGSRTNYTRCCNCRSALKSFASSKGGCGLASLRPWNFWNLKIRSRSRSCIIDIFILTIFIVGGNMSGGWSFLGHDSAFDRIIVSFFLDFLVSIDDCSLPLIHSPHGLACEIRWGFVVIKRADGGNFVTARTDILVNLDLLNLFAFGLRPGYSSTFDDAHIRIILTRTDFVFLFPFEVLDRRLVQLQLVVFVLVVAIGVNIRRDRGNRLILVQIYQMLQNFRLCCSIGAHSFGSNLQTSLVAE